MDDALLACGTMIATADATDSPKRRSSKLGELRERAKSMTSAKLDPREAYRQSCDPDDPTHENYPKLDPSGEGGLVPVVLAGVGQPDLSDVRAGMAAACKKFSKMGMAAFVVYMGLLIYQGEDAVACGTDTGTSAKSECFGFTDAAGIQYAEQCNGCTSAYDNVCDEPSGACAWGTDSYDCWTANQTALALEIAASNSEVDGGNFVWLFLLTMLAVVVLPCLGCAGIICPQKCGRWRFASIPVVSDMVFEVFRSRALVIIETTAIFLLLAGYAFDTRLCNRSFGIHPTTAATAPSNDLVDGTVLAWPSDVVQTVTSFHDDDDTTHKSMVALFTLRFVFCNVANGRWQAIGNNLTGAAYFIAVFFSLWSLSVLGNDASYCRYPTDVSTNTDGGYVAPDGTAAGMLSYCTIYADSVPGGSMAAGKFMADCKAQAATGWNKTQTGFYEVYEPATITPQSGLEVEEPAQCDLLPSLASAFQEKARLNIRTAYSSHSEWNPAAMPIPDGLDLTTTPPGYYSNIYSNAQCPVKLGSVMEAVATYADACEDNSRMRDATLLSISQSVLNLMELLVLVQIGVGMGHISCLPAMITPSNHADTAAASTPFYYPVRMMGAVSVSALLIFFFMATIDLMALRVKNSIVPINAAYNDLLVSMLSGPDAAFQNSYFDDGAGRVPPYQARPPFNGLDDDCPCSILSAVQEVATELSGPVTTLVTAQMGGSRRRQLEVVPTSAQLAPPTQFLPQLSSDDLRRLQQGGCPVHASLKPNGGCVCDDGYAVVQGQWKCQPSSNDWRRLQQGICPPHSQLIDPQDPNSQCYCDEGYTPVSGQCQEGAADPTAQAIADIERVVEDPQTGKVIKCSFEALRMFWEPLPFCIRCE